MSTVITFTKTTVTQTSIKLFLSKIFLSLINLTPNQTFVASNGIVIKWECCVLSRYENGELTLNSGDRIHMIRNVSRPERLETALTEFGENGTASWEIVGSFGRGLGLAFMRISEQKTCHRLFVPEAVYDWATQCEFFQASNGIRIACKKDYAHGFVSDTLYLNDSARGREIELDFQGRAEQVTTALTELQEFQKQVNETSVPIKIHLSEPAYRFGGEKGFKASNGIFIYCSKMLTPCLYGDNLQFNEKFEGKEVEVTCQNFENYKGLVARREEIMEALVELETEAKGPRLKRLFEELKREDIALVEALVEALKERK